MEKPGLNGEIEKMYATENPVSDILYIEINPPANSKTQITFDIRLYDGFSNLLRQTKTTGGTVQFDV